jgi:hypothetical protein
VKLPDGKKLNRPFLVTYRVRSWHGGIAHHCNFRRPKPLAMADAVHAVLGACPDGDRLTDDYAALRDGSIKAWTPPEE